MLHICDFLCWLCYKVYILVTRTPIHLIWSRDFIQTFGMIMWGNLYHLRDNIKQYNICKSSMPRMDQQPSFQSDFCRCHFPADDDDNEYGYVADDDAGDDADGEGTDDTTDTDTAGDPKRGARGEPSIDRWHKKGRKNWPATIKIV